MSRIGTIAVYAAAALAMVIAAAIIVFPGEAIWLAVALVPAALLAMLLVNLRAPADRSLRLSQPSGQPPTRLGGGFPVELRGETRPRGGVEGDHPGADVWIGTLRIRPHVGGPVSTVPLRVALGVEPLAVRLLPLETTSTRQHRITAIEALEHDAIHDAIHLRVVVRRPGHPAAQCLTLGLRRVDDAWMPLDDTDEVTAELRRPDCLVTPACSDADHQSPAVCATALPGS
jgi:hypothetical protein